MARKHVINLVSQPDFKVTSFGKIAAWSLSIGRWIVIVTQIVVIGAFIYRITLDQQINDLQEDIEQKRSQVASFARTEEEIRQTQKQLTMLEEILAEHREYQTPLLDLARSLPPELALDNIRISTEDSQLKGTARTEQSISTFIENLRKSPYFTNIDLSRVTLNQTNQSAYDFDISLQLVTSDL